jgi:hypothetical protein
MLLILHIFRKTLCKKRFQIVLDRIMKMIGSSYKRLLSVVVPRRSATIKAMSTASAAEASNNTGRKKIMVFGGKEAVHWQGTWSFDIIYALKEMVSLGKVSLTLPFLKESMSSLCRVAEHLPTTNLLPR